MLALKHAAGEWELKICIQDHRPRAFSLGISDVKAWIIRENSSNPDQNPMNHRSQPVGHAASFRAARCEWLPAPKGQAAIQALSVTECDLPPVSDNQARLRRAKPALQPLIVARYHPQTSILAHIFINAVFSSSPSKESLD
jgi:hypothetical protein